MTRRIANPGLAALLARKSRALREPFIVADLACLCKTHRSAIHLYATGRKPMPRLEKKIARVFGISVARLRRELFGGEG